MTNDQIKAILMKAGFTEKDQGNGRMDLHPYVYDAARSLLTAQLAELGWFPCSPELLASGVDCATAPRVLGSQGVSHYHQAAQQHQGEPVALPAEKELVRAWGHDTGGNYEEGKAFGWNACLDEIAKLGPLYTHAQMAERDALLQQAIDNEESFNFDQTLIVRIKRLLSASAEPSAQKITTTEDNKMKDDKNDLPNDETEASFRVNGGKDFSAYKLEASAPKYIHMHLSVNREHGEARSLAELYKHFFVDGVLPELGDEIRMVCTGRTADHLEINLKAFPKTQKWAPYGEDFRDQHPGQVLTPMSDYASAEPSAPVEIDERAEFEKWWSSLTSVDPYTKGEHWDAWQARAALERK